MKKFVIAMVIIILLGAVLSGIGCAVYFSGDLRVGTKNVEYYEKSFETDETFSVLDLDLEDAHKVSLVRGDKCSVTYFDTNITEISVSVQNNTLVISENGWSGISWIKRLLYKLRTTEIVITVPEGVVLDIECELDGATELILPNWQYSEIDLSVRGACNVMANDIEATDISLDVSGATNIVMSGKANSLKTQVSGAVKVRCDNFDCPSIDVRSSGSSELNLSGTGRELTLRASGSGRIWAKNFALDTVNIDASGSVEAELTVSALLKVNSSGSANISYWGDPRVDKSTSGSSNIVKKG